MFMPFYPYPILLCKLKKYILWLKKIKLKSYLKFLKKFLIYNITIHKAPKYELYDAHGQSLYLKDF